MCNDSMDLQKQKLNKISLNLLKYIFYKGRLLFFVLDIFYDK